MPKFFKFENAEKTIRSIIQSIMEGTPIKRPNIQYSMYETNNIAVVTPTEGTINTSFEIDILDYNTYYIVILRDDGIGWLLDFQTDIFSFIPSNTINTENEKMTVGTYTVFGTIAGEPENWQTLTTFTVIPDGEISVIPNSCKITDPVKISWNTTQKRIIRIIDEINGWSINQYSDQIIIPENLIENGISMTDGNYSVYTYNPVSEVFERLSGLSILTPNDILGVVPSIATVDTPIYLYTNDTGYYTVILDFSTPQNGWVLGVVPNGYSFIPSQLDPPLTLGNYVVWRYIVSEYVQFGTFTLTDINIVNSISQQWNTVYLDNRKLTLGGLYNDTASYTYAYNIEEVNLNDGTPLNTSAKALPPNNVNPVPTTSSNRQTMNYSSNNLCVGTAIGNIGVNNGSYYLNVIQSTTSTYFTINTNYIKLSGESIDSTVVENYTLPTTKSMNVIGTNGDKNSYVATNYNIVDVINPTLSFSNNYVDIITSGNFTITGTTPSNLYPNGTDKYLYANGLDIRTFFSASTNADVWGFYKLNATEKNIDPYEEPFISKGYFLLRIQPPGGITITTTNLNTLKTAIFTWGGLTYNSTVAVDYTKKFYKGQVTMVVNIPIGERTDEYIISAVDVNSSGISGSEYTLANKVVVCSNCIYNPTFLAPIISLKDVTYATIYQMAAGRDYLPTMIPAGDYLITASGNDTLVGFTDGSSQDMDADRCRQPWRLSHYVRNSLDTDARLLKVAYNTACALVFSAMTTNLNKWLSLNVNITNFTNSNTNYSADMVPPLVSLIDALRFNTPSGITLESAITDYADFIKNLNNGTLSASITLLQNGSDNVYPILDANSGGGQQLGLAGCGFICTLDCLSRPNFDVMLKYDNVIPWETGVHHTKFNNSYTNPTSDLTIISDARFFELITLYKMQATLGRGCNFSTWPRDTQSTVKSCAEAVLPKAYLTNLRVRGVNISQVDELSFGSNEQGINSNVQNITSTYGGTNYSSEYKFTYFPMYAIPDSGWGSITVEIFSYLGIVFVGMNDYSNFCKWHRAYYYFLFVQNGGDMFSWNESDEDKITPQNAVQCPSVNDFWLPPYLDKTEQTDEDGNSENWSNDVILANTLRGFTIFDWPPEHYYNGKPIKSTTNYWANRFTPYRGDTTVGKVRWSTPSYCMGYSPAWVAGGKTNTVNFSDQKINRPVAEALNPYFIGTLGLYSALDGDENALQAYILASLRWPDTPPISTSNGYEGDTPSPPTDRDTPGIYGYDCDVADFNYNTDMKKELNTESLGVKQALTHFGSETNPITNKQIYCTEKIGYGITYNGFNGIWDYIKDDNGERCTTWKYMAKSIQRTMISKHGNGWTNDTSKFGCFTTLSGFKSSADPVGARFTTLGHDSSASPSIKLDYIDPRLYQVCSTLTQNES